MAGRGGYQAPSKPAAVSGPGALSQRTDGQAIRDITGGDYGDASEFRQLQQSAPLAAASGPSAAPASAGGGLPQVTPFGAPSTMPGTPVTDGASMGAGMGPQGMGLAQSPQDAQREDADFLSKYLPAMIAIAQSGDATPSFKNYVRTLIANLH